MPLLNAITRLDYALRAAGIPIDGVAGPQAAVRVDYDASATPAQRAQAQAIVAAFDWSPSADATFAAQQAKARAAGDLDAGATQGGAPSDRLIRALAMVMLAELNLLRTAAALPARTPAQLIGAVKAQITASAE